jgi:hypothetical protein
MGLSEVIHATQKQVIAEYGWPPASRTKRPERTPWMMTQKRKGFEKHVPADPRERDCGKDEEEEAGNKEAEEFSPRERFWFGGQGSNGGRVFGSSR